MRPGCLGAPPHQICHRLPALGSSLPHKSQKLHRQSASVPVAKAPPGSGASVLEAWEPPARRPRARAPRPDERRASLLRAQPRSARPCTHLASPPAGGLAACALSPGARARTVVAVVPAVTEGGGGLSPAPQKLGEGLYSPT